MLTFTPPIIAHRGASSQAPENTLSAFRQAKKIGLHWVEFDVMLAACGEVIVFHDDTLQRTTNGHGLVIDYPYSWLKTLDAGSWFHPNFVGEKIPTFTEVLNLLRELKLNANIEIKSLPGYEEQTVTQVLTVLQQHVDTPFLISSFSLFALRLVRQYSPHAVLGLLLDKWIDDWSALCHELHCQSVSVNYQVLSADRVNQLKEAGVAVLAYTVNDSAQAQQLFSWGVDAVFSDGLNQIPLSSHVF